MVFARQYGLGRFFVHKHYYGEQNDAAQQAAHSVERKRTDIVHADALSDERDTPNSSGEQEQECIFELHLRHKDSSFADQILENILSSFAAIYNTKVLDIAAGT